MAERKWTDWITSPWESAKAKASEIADSVGKWITKKTGDLVEGAARERLGPVADMLLPSPAGAPTGTTSPSADRSAAPAPAGVPSPSAAGTGTPSPSPAPKEGGWLEGLKKMFGIGVDTSSGEKSGFDWGKLAKNAGTYGAAILGGVMGFQLMSGGGLLMGIIGALVGYAIAMAVATPLVKWAGEKLGGLIGGKSNETGGPAQSQQVLLERPPVKATAVGKDGKVDVDPPAGGVVATAIAYAKSGYNRGHALVKGLPQQYYNVIDMLEERGFTKEQAAGAVANLHQESNLNPYAVGDGGKAKGIAQWHGPRQEEFRKRYGHAIDDRSVGADRLLREQVDFIVHEMTAGTEQAAGRKFLATRTAAEAGAVFSKDYERPAAVQAEANNRAATAEVVYAAAVAKAKATASGKAPAPAVDNRGTVVAEASAPLPSPAGNSTVTVVRQNS